MSKKEVIYQLFTEGRILIIKYSELLAQPGHLGILLDFI